MDNTLYSPLLQDIPLQKVGDSNEESQQQSGQIQIPKYAKDEFLDRLRTKAKVAQANSEAYASQMSYQLLTDPYDDKDTLNKDIMTLMNTADSHAEKGWHAIEWTVQVNERAKLEMCKHMAQILKKRDEDPRLKGNAFFTNRVNSHFAKLVDRLVVALANAMGFPLRNDSPSYINGKYSPSHGITKTTQKNHYGIYIWW